MQEGYELPDDFVYEDEPDTDCHCDIDKDAKG